MATAQKLDLYKKHKAEYAATKTPQLLTVKPASYLTITGQGEPGGEVFTAKIGGLYAVAFTIKFARKAAGRDYAVCKLEGQWWGTGKGNFADQPRDQWKWKLLIRTPSFITKQDLAKAVKELLDKGKGPEVTEVNLETIEEGSCVQMLHVGPYDTEGETVAAMKDFAKQSGFSFHGRHHEIYLSDPRRVAPERLRTILRQPVR
ncbi:MAG: GyrI-like domain-containing protein [Planctomycetota bacterium]|jgi:hypothetical protein